ncbi:MAG TPA: HAD family hydrolase [Rubrivivax sp.]|nr:HAD family hydrolase [Rubrivivax sp.]
MNVALFDLDGTLLDADSDHAFGQFLLAEGWAGGEEHRRRNDEFYAQYLAERLDIAAYIEFATAPWRDRDPREVESLRQRFVDAVIRPAVRPVAIDLVRHHQAAGDRVAVVTATNDFVTRPIADLFGVETLIATELMRDATGRPDGRIRGTPAFRQGKVARVRQWLAGLGQTLEGLQRSTFYSDSRNDLPLLEAVSHPVATNPSDSLEAFARERGWPILRLFA